jgi:large subunit ribosomal protein L21
MYAIILTGGKQYRVSEGETVFVEKLNKNVGEEIIFDKILVVRNGEKAVIGTPVVKNAKVVAEIVKQGRGPKIIVFKKHSKKGYKKTQGHRQDLTELKIKKIECKSTAAKK